MSNHYRKPSVKAAAKVDTPQHTLPQHDGPDDRYPGTFFRIPGIPAPGKTTWSVVK